MKNPLTKLNTLSKTIDLVVAKKREWVEEHREEILAEKARHKKEATENAKKQAYYWGLELADEERHARELIARIDRERYDQRKT